MILFNLITKFYNKQIMKKKNKIEIGKANFYGNMGMAFTQRHTCISCDFYACRARR